MASLLKENWRMSLEHFRKIDLNPLLILENLTILFRKFQIVGPLYCKEPLPNSVFTPIILNWLLSLVDLVDLETLISLAGYLAVLRGKVECFRKQLLGY